jgi:hypothetical protein
MSSRNRGSLLCLGNTYLFIWVSDACNIFYARALRMCVPFRRYKTVLQWEVIVRPGQHGFGGFGIMKNDISPDLYRAVASIGARDPNEVSSHQENPEVLGASYRSLSYLRGMDSSCINFHQRPTRDYFFSKITPRPVRDLFFSKITPRPVRDLFFSKITPRPIRDFFLSKITPKTSKRLILSQGLIRVAQ